MPTIDDRLRDLASDAPTGTELPATLARRARRRMATTLITAVAGVLVVVALTLGGIGVMDKTEPAVTPSPRPPGSPGLWGPGPFAFAPDGSMYVSSCILGQVDRVDAAGAVTAIANERVRDGYSGDGGPALKATFVCPGGVAVDATGDVYVADTGNNRIRMIDPSGVVTTVAGSGPTGFGNGGFAGDDGPATEARLQAPTWIALDNAGNLYIADRDNNAVRRVDTGGVISTIARGPQGTGTAGPGRHGSIDDPAGIAFGPGGVLYVADSNHARIRMIEPNGSIVTIAGTGHAGYAGDGGPAIDARIANPGGLATDGDGNIYFADTDNHVIRKIDPSGTITTVAGTGQVGCPIDGAAAAGALLTDPSSVAVGQDGRLYLSDSACGSIYVLDTDGTIHTFATR